MSELDSYRNRSARPLMCVEALSLDPATLIDKAPSQVLAFLEQADLSPEDKAEAFGAIVTALGEFALKNPDLMITVNWQDEYGLPQPMLADPTETLRLISASNVLELNSRTPVKA